MAKDTEDLDLMELVERVIDSNYDASVLDEVESYRPLIAPNIFEWITNPRFLSSSIEPWPRQVYFLATFFEDYCPMRLCTDRRFLENTIEQVPMETFREKVTFLEFGVCPNCGATRRELVEEGYFHYKNDFVGCAGQRSSKTAMVGGMIATYHLHRVLALPSPWRFYGLLPNQKLHYTFVAITKQQAKDTLWDEFKGTYSASPWFEDYNDYLTNEGKRLGKIFVKDMETYVAYIHKRISITYADAHKQKLRGQTRIFAAEDEIGWMDDDTRHVNKGTRGQRIVADADETYEALENSLQTIRSEVASKRSHGSFDVIDAVHATVSSPSRVTDKSMRLVRQANDIPTMFAFHMPTWEINPKITRESLEPKFVKDPHKARLNFGADPPFGANAYVGDHTMVEVLCTGNPICKIEEKFYTTDNGFSYVYQRLVSLLEMPSIPMCISVDMGEKYNHFSIVVTHLTPDANFVMLNAFDIAPREYNGRLATVNFNRVFDNLMVPLITKLSVRDVIYDRWNSTDQIQKIREIKTPFAPKGVIAEQNTPKYEHGMEFRSNLTSMQFPKMENSFDDIRKDHKRAITNAPHTHFAFQLVTVREVGRSLRKGIDSEDDIFRAALNAFAWMRMVDNITAYTDHSGFVSRGKRGGGGLGVYAGLSKGSSQSVTSSSSSLGVYSSRSGKGGGGGYTGSSLGVMNGKSKR